ncbi:MAG: glycerate kinase [Bacillus sp. (in: firmicutes)]
MSKTFVLAPDSFKGSMTAKEVCIAMETGIKKADPYAKCIHAPMADGGEGTVQSLIDATGGKLIYTEVTGPLGEKVNAKFGILGDEKTAVIEMAEASGIQYVNEQTKNPLLTTSYGTGELIKECLNKGLKKIIIGVGGSATNDGGAGMAEALGVKFIDRDGKILQRGGGSLDELGKIDLSNIDLRLKETEIFVACDVTNPLCGATGASYVFGPQKGATNEMIRLLDNNLEHYAKVVKEQLNKEVKNLPGAGAAGGLGAGLMIFTKAVLKNGIDLVVEYSNLRDKIKHADYVITGEGGIDFQTQFGKTPYGVAKVAKEQNIKVIAIAGFIGEGIDILYEKGIDAIFGIIPKADQLDSLLSEGRQNVERTCENIARVLLF